MGAIYVMFRASQIDEDKNVSKNIVFFRLRFLLYVGVVSSEFWEGFGKGLELPWRFWSAFGVFLCSLYRQCFPKDVLGAPGLVFGCISKDLGGSGGSICGVKGWFWVAIWISFRDLKLYLGIDSKKRDFVKIVLPSRRNIIFLF